jgi:hypothetical protein
MNRCRTDPFGAETMHQREEQIDAKKEGRENQQNESEAHRNDEPK